MRKKRETKKEERLANKFVSNKIWISLRDSAMLKMNPFKLFTMEKDKSPTSPEIKCLSGFIPKLYYTSLVHLGQHLKKNSFDDIDHCSQ
jgi:hypothetical protein